MMDTIIVRFGCNNVHQPKMTKELNHCYVWLRHKKNRRQMPAAFWMQLITQSELSSLCSLFDGNCGGNGHTDHIKGCTALIGNGITLDIGTGMEIMHDRGITTTRAHHSMTNAMGHQQSREYIYIFFIAKHLRMV